MPSELLSPLKGCGSEQLPRKWQKPTFRPDGSLRRVKRHRCIFFPITRHWLPLGVLHSSTPNLLGTVLQPFLGRISLANKKGGEGCGKANEIRTFSCVQEKQEPAGDAIRAEPRRGECSCASLCAAPAADLLSPDQPWLPRRCWQLPRALPGLHAGCFSFQTSERLEQCSCTSKGPAEPEGCGRRG